MQERQLIELRGEGMTEGEDGTTTESDPLLMCHPECVPFECLADPHSVAVDE